MNVYMDESGSVHPVDGSLNRFFIIGVALPNNHAKLKRVYKVFVRKKFDALKKLDKNHKMFREDGSFIELKGACFNHEMKVEFMRFFCQNEVLKIGYVMLDNHKLQSKFIENKARTFNYLLKLFFTNALQRKYIADKELFLQIDERNIRTDSKFSLEDYLNQEIVLNLDLLEDIKVKYYNSVDNQLIQVADVFSNILYSNLVTQGAYQQELMQLRRAGYLLPMFRFPK